MSFRVHRDATTARHFSFDVGLFLNQSLTARLSRLIVRQSTAAGKVSPPGESFVKQNSTAHFVVCIVGNCSAASGIRDASLQNPLAANVGVHIEGQYATASRVVQHWTQDILTAGIRVRVVLDGATYWKNRLF